MIRRVSMRRWISTPFVLSDINGLEVCDDHFTSSISKLHHHAPWTWGINIFIKSTVFLVSFTFMEQRDATIITTTADTRVGNPAGREDTQPGSCALSDVRGFVQHLHSLDPRMEIPPTGIITYREPNSTLSVYRNRDTDALGSCTSVTTSTRLASLDISLLVRTSGSHGHCGLVRHWRCSVKILTFQYRGPDDP